MSVFQLEEGRSGSRRAEGKQFPLRKQPQILTFHSKLSHGYTSLQGKLESAVSCWGVGRALIQLKFCYCEGRKSGLSDHYQLPHAFKLYPDDWQSCFIYAIKGRIKEEESVSGFLQCVDSDLVASYVKHNQDFQ